MVYVTKRIEFCASHQLYAPNLSEAENERIYGRCSRSIHGHNYTLDVTVRGEPDPVTGMVINLSDLKDLLRSRIAAVLDHDHLNDAAAMLEGRVPTTENLAVAIWKALEGNLPGGELDEVRLRETASNWVSYRGRGRQR